MPKSLPGTVKNTKKLNSVFSFLNKNSYLCTRNPERECLSGKIWLLATTEKNAKTAFLSLCPYMAEQAVEAF